MSRIKDRHKALKINSVHAQKLEEIRLAFGMSSRKAGAFILGYVYGIESIVKESHSSPSTSKLAEQRNIFLPMTDEQFDSAIDQAKKLGYDFSTIFKVAVDKFYEEWKGNGVDLQKTAFIRRILKGHL